MSKKQERIKFRVPPGPDASAVAGTRQARKQPLQPQQGKDPRATRGHAEFNSHLAVGNLGVYFGNWGTRATLTDGKAKRDRIDRHDKQIVCTPAQIIMLAEASEQVETLLKLPNKAAFAGNEWESEDEDQAKFGIRESREYYVVRGNEFKSLLVGARTDNCDNLTLKEWLLLEDHPYKQYGKDNMATTRLMVRNVGFKQNVGHLGTVIPVSYTHLTLPTSDLV